MNILSYPDSNVSQGMGGEGGMNSAVVTYSYIAVRPRCADEA